jgi:hypothetical protein
MSQAFTAASPSIFQQPPSPTFPNSSYLNLPLHFPVRNNPPPYSHSPEKADWLQVPRLDNSSHETRHQHQSQHYWCWGSARMDARYCRGQGAWCQCGWRRYLSLFSRRKGRSRPSRSRLVAIVLLAMYGLVRRFGPEGTRYEAQDGWKDVL